VTVAFINTVDWGELEHAYGGASDLPALLKQVASTKGVRLHKPIGELYSRVLHQGTIYSASPPAAHAVIEMLVAAAPAEKEIFYDLMTGFAEAARKAFADGRAIPCCAGGDPEDGAAIQREVLTASPKFVPDLTHTEAAIRRGAASLLTAFPEADASMARLVRDRWTIETDSSVREAMVKGLAQVRGSFIDWPEFLHGAVATEGDAYIRFLLRLEQVSYMKGDADEATVDDLIHTAVEGRASETFAYENDARFFEALEGLGEARNVAPLLATLTLAKEDDQLRMLAERLLRAVFHDERTGWGGTSSSLEREDGSHPPSQAMSRQIVKLVLKLILWKLFPFMARAAVRNAMKTKPNGVRKVEYWGLDGRAPEIPETLNHQQRTVLQAFAAKEELWAFRTNLWHLFGLPDNADGMRKLLDS
jgi:hypothetical protein